MDQGRRPVRVQMGFGPQFMLLQFAPVTWGEPLAQRSVLPDVDLPWRAAGWRIMVVGLHFAFFRKENCFYFFERPDPPKTREARVLARKGRCELLCPH